MNTHELIAEINQLELSEKILLVEDIWDSVAADNGELPEQSQGYAMRYGNFRGAVIRRFPFTIYFTI